MTITPYNDSESVEVRNNAILIAKYLKTSHETKKHGGYDIYEDEKIRIRYDTYYPNMTIDIKDTGSTMYFHRVYSGSSIDNPGTYKPGKWTQYISKLSMEAKKIEQQRKDEWKATVEAERLAKFGPVHSSLDKIFEE